MRADRLTPTLGRPTNPPAFPLPCVVTLTRVAPRLLDEHDNLRASLKACVDGISQRLAVKDPAQGAAGARIALQEAFSGEDISDRPEPATVVPALLALIEGDLPGGRYRASELVRVPA